MYLPLKYFFPLFFIITEITASAQEFGGNPPYIKWQQVNTPAVRVIFPKGLDSIARAVGSMVHQLSTTTQGSIGAKLHKINIVLQKETTISNAYVALGPYRSEFYLTPPQNSFNIGSLPWHEQLAIHEFRHVQQNNNFNVGLSRLARIMFGEEGQALANSLVIPDWFYEGDAVFNETQVSRQGRGRLPFFFNDFRALWSSGRNYSWMKLRNGSYRDFTPDHYRLGYILVAYAREKFGDDFWKKVTQDAASYKGLFYPFQKAIKKYAGEDYHSFRNSAVNYFKNQPAIVNKISRDNQSLKQHFFADEEYPAFINDTSVIFVKSSYKQVRAFTVRTGNVDKKLRVRDVSIDSYFSYRNGKVVYAAFRPDIRWGWKNFSDIMLLDVKTGAQRSVTSHTKYFSPDISEDGSTIVAVHADPAGRSALHFIDAGNGSLITAVPNPDKFIYTHPKFYNTWQVVTALRNIYGRMALAVVDAAKGTTVYLTSFSFNVIGFPFVRNDTVYFTASQNGNDRLFASSIANHTLYELVADSANNVTGQYQPAANTNALAWSRFTATGYRLQEINRKDVAWKNIVDAPSALNGFGITAINKNPTGDLPARLPMTVTKYSKSYRLINFHSLHPLADDPLYSFSLIGENVLNTLQSEVFLNYNRNEQYTQLGFNAIYGAWFSFVSAGTTYTMDRRALYHNQRIYWNEWEFRGGASLPLNLSKGRNFTRLNIGADYVYNQPTFKGVFKDSLGNRSFGYANMHASFTNQVQQARQHIYPRLAQTLQLNYKRAISNFNANQFLVTGSLYLPGLWLNHSLVFNAAFQQKDTLSQRSFSNNFPFSRGYSAENFYKMSKLGVNYHFPLCYPDAGFGNIIYVLRVRSNIFYDHTVVTDYRLKSANFRSLGSEVFFDTKWWNHLPLSIGFRYSYLLDQDLFGSASNRFEIVLPVNLLQR